MNYELESITGENNAEKINKERAAKKKYKDKLLANRTHLINLITHANSKDGLTMLRKDANTENTTQEEKQRQVDMFESFCNNCLVFMIKKRDWKQRRNSDLISKFITIPDEAMGVLALENMAPDLIEYINTTSIEDDGENEETPGDVKKTSKAKYTSSKGGGSFGVRGWHSSGIKRYNELCANLKPLRETETSKALENGLKKKYRSEHSLNIHQTDGEESDCYESEAMAVIPYDMFAAV
jgi:hypothetical protein